MNQSKRLKDGALLTTIYIILLLVTILFPLTSMILTFVLPVPFIIFAARHDWKPSLIMLTATIILSALFATVFSLPLSLLYGIGGIMIGAAIKRKLSAYETWARGTVGFVAGLLFALLFAQVLFDISFVEELNERMNDTIQISQSMMSEFGLDEEIIEQQISIVEESLSTFNDLLPMLLVMMGLIQALISQWIGYKVSNRIEKSNLRFPEFRNLQFPVAIIWIYFIALVVSLLQQDPDSILFMGLQNVLILTGFFMAIQGFSFFFFFAYYKKMSKSIPIIVTIISLVLLPLLLPLIRILGIIDIGFGLRDRMMKNEKK
ncbi:YybS family protein [Ornithinibacillus salinisoli]|uniref:YybS family protein n=1 Tax=Ornithinibacillus salinisoli TaxID=1848459 RepID=A0ABW4W4F8_9BACI